MIRNDLNSKYGNFSNEKGSSLEEEKLINSINKLVGLFYYKNDRTEVFIEDKDYDYLIIFYNKKNKTSSIK